MKYYIIAGEASGDMHAANLMAELKKLDSSATFRCWGGDRMINEGGIVVRHIKELSFMGFVEVILNLKTIIGNLKFCKKDIAHNKPDVLILVDYPGFNLRIASYAKKLGITVFYYISPSVWAWKTSRIEIIKQSVDKLFAILPFEKEFYKKHNCAIEYEGHPLLDEFEKIKPIIPSREKFIAENKLSGKKIIACLPGSRKQEIKKMFKEMLNQQKKFNEFEFVVAAAPNITPDFYTSVANDIPFKLLNGKTYELLFHADVGLIKSGTSTLEAALFDLPLVCCYKGSPVSIWIAKKLTTIRFISLPNLIMNKPIIKELIQEDMNEKNLEYELRKLLFDENEKSNIKQHFSKLREVLGGKGASQRIAIKMMNFLNVKNNK